MIVKDEITADYIGIQCDACETMAPDVKAIQEGHGLNNMGWYCSGGTHFCPDHAPPKPVIEVLTKEIGIEKIVSVGERLRLGDDPAVWEIFHIQGGSIFLKLVNGTGR